MTFSFFMHMLVEKTLGPVARSDSLNLQSAIYMTQVPPLNEDCG
jgi:hypothetical protein